MSNFENLRKTRTSRRFLTGTLLLTLAAFLTARPFFAAGDADGVSENGASDPASMTLTPMTSATDPASSASEASSVIPSAEMPSTDISGNTVSTETPAALEKREGELLDRLAELQPTAPDYQVQIQKIGAELRDVQGRLQRFRQLSPLTGSMDAPFGSAAALSATPAENGTLSEFSLTGTVPESPSPFAGLDVTYLSRLKEELTSQLKQIRQTLDALGPQDAALNESLREQQTDLLNQLKEVNERLGGNASVPADPQSPQESAAANPSLVSSFPTDTAETSIAPSPAPFPGAPGLNPISGFAPSTAALPNLNVAAGTDSMSLAVSAERVRKANAAAVLLREAGLNSLANQVLNQAASISDPHFDESAVSATGISADGDGSWFGSDNKNQKILDQISELKKANDDLKQGIAEISEELKNIETQLKLLSRQAVSNPASAPASSLPQ